jgi:regulator of protease activity HflC (stomatin/prohibitin superfamily)
MTSLPSLVLQADPGLVFVGISVLVVGIGSIYSSIRIVDDHEKHALTVFGEYRKLLHPGVNFVPPFISDTYPFDLHTQTVDIPAQETMTDDDLRLTSSGTISFRVIDVKKSFLQVEDHKRAISNLSQTTLRVVLQEMGSDAIHNHSGVGDRVRRDLSEVADEWGIRIESVDIQDVQEMYE